MKKIFLKNRKWFLIGLSAIVLIAYLSLAFVTMYLFRSELFFGDMTTEGLYTMTEPMEKTMEDVPDGVKISFCADPDVLLQNKLLSYVYILAMQLAKANSHITIETNNLTQNPHAYDAYKTTSVSTFAYDDVIISYGNKFRTAKAEAFYTLDEGGEYWSFKGEYQLASMILSVTKVLEPCAYFTIGHGEKAYDPKNPDSADSLDLEPFVNMLLDAGIRVDTINLDQIGQDGAIPMDCVLLIMNGPTEDYSSSSYHSFYAQSSIEKIDRYLEGRGNLLFLRNTDVSMTELPTVSQYLAEWGFAFNDDIVRDAKSGQVIESERENISVVYATQNTSSVSYSVYSSIADLNAAPRTVLKKTSSLEMLWKDTEERTFNEKTSRMASPLFYSSETAKTYNSDGELVSDEGTFPLGALSITAYFASDATYSYSYVSALGTMSMIEKEFMSSNTYGNKDIMHSLVRVMTRTDTYADSELGSSTDLNAENYGGKRYEKDNIVETTTYYYKRGNEKYITTSKIGNKTGYELHRTMVPLEKGQRNFLTVVLCLVPVLCIGAAGFVVLQRRKHR